VVAIIATDNSTGTLNRLGVYLSIDGGTTWTTYVDLNPITDGTYTAASLNAIAFSPLVGTVRTLAVGGTNTNNSTGVWCLEVGGFISHWTDITKTVSGGWTNTNFGPTDAAWALKFSPNFAGDRTLAVVTGPAGLSANVTVSVQLANFANKLWNAGPSNNIYVGWANGIAIETLIAGEAVQSASLALAPGYLGQDSGSRLLYVGLSTNSTTPALVGGVYRFNDITKYELLNESTAAGIQIHSVSVNAAGDKLVAGAYATNVVYRLASPATASYSSALYTTTYKSPGFS
jgi:hypothetical protein